MYRIGIDLGGTNIVAAVVDDNYNMVAKAKTPTAIPRTPDEIFDDIARVSKEAMAEAGITIADIKSVGIGTPGTVNAEGIIEYANNLGFDHVPAKQMLIDRLGCQNVYVENDANCAALGEAVAGCGHGAKDFVAVTLGTGVGSGIIIDGKIVAFTGVTEDNRITGLFVDPEYQNKGIGTALINFLKSEYNMLHIPIYARNRKALAFATRTGFIIDGALRHEHNGEVMYTMLWNM